MLRNFLFIGLLISLANPLLALSQNFALGSACNEYKPYAVKKALSQALKNACERAGVDVSGWASVRNGMFSNLYVSTRCKAKIKVLSKKCTEINTFDVNQVCVNCKITYEVVRGNITSFGLDISAYDLRTNFPKTTFKEGEIVKITLKTEKPCYAYVFEIDPKGYVSRIIPQNGVSDEQIHLRGSAYFWYKVESYTKKYPQSWSLMFVCSEKPLQALRKIPTFDKNISTGYFKRFGYSDLETLLFHYLGKVNFDVDIFPFEVEK